MKMTLWLGLAAFLACGALAFGGDEVKKPDEGKKDPPKKENPLPEGARGFAGQLKGTVAKKRDRGIDLKVTEVVKTWEASKATDAKVLVGLTVRVTASWVKGEGDNKKGHPNELQMAFLRTLEVDKEVTLDVKNVERDVFVITELTKEQAEVAKNAKKPEGDKGEKKPEGEGDKKPEPPKKEGEF